MKTLITISVSTLLMLSSGIVSARDIGPDEAGKLQASGSIQSTEKLNAAALAKHPGATITDTELDEEYGNYVYQVDLTDSQGVKWDVELDAATANILKDHQDR